MPSAALLQVRHVVLCVVGLLAHIKQSRNPSSASNIWRSTCYPVRCAHIPPPCHFSVCSDLLVFLTAGVLIFIRKVINFSIIFEARAIILEARSPMDDFWDCCDFYRTKCVRYTPPRRPWTHFLRSRDVVFVFECSCFWIRVILSAQRLHSGFHFDSFWGALGLLKNS